VDARLEMVHEPKINQLLGVKITGTKVSKQSLPGIH
jgi:hypothetical protein